MKMVISGKENLELNAVVVILFYHPNGCSIYIDSKLI